MTLRSAAKLSLPAPQPSPEETRNLRILVEEDRQSSGESVDFNPIHSVLEEEEDDEEPPRILFYHEPRSFEVGMLVWLKHQKYPFWPAVVKSVRRRDKKASVLFIEGHMDPKGRGITVSLKRLKHFDCKEKQALLVGGLCFVPRKQPPCVGSGALPRDGGLLGPAPAVLAGTTTALGGCRPSPRCPAQRTVCPGARPAS